MNASHSRKVPLTEKEPNRSKSGLPSAFYGCRCGKTTYRFLAARETTSLPQNRVLCRLGDSEFDDGLGGNLDLLLRLGIEARACLPLLLYELAKSRQDEFAVLFNLFVRERAERIEKYSSGSFVGLCGFGKCALKFCLGHV